MHVALLMMEPGVIGPRENDEVRRPIVGLDSVHMVDVLEGVQLALQDGLHHQARTGDVCVIHEDEKASLVVDRPAMPALTPVAALVADHSTGSHWPIALRAWGRMVLAGLVAAPARLGFCHLRATAQRTGIAHRRGAVGPTPAQRLDALDVARLASRLFEPLQHTAVGAGALWMFPATSAQRFQKQPPRASACFAGSQFHRPIVFALAGGSQ